MASKNKFIIGEIVTLKTHPLFKTHSKIIEFPAHVPPLMVVKEVFFEDLKKKKLYSEELGKDFQISDSIKYTCVYFNANKSEFEEVFVYESFLESYKELKYYRHVKEDEVVKIELDNQLIPEVLKYESIDKYEFGKVIQFKTKKLEQRKSYDGKIESIVYSFQSPNFILGGIKNENITDLYYPDGENKKNIPSQSVKVVWFNHFQQKNSEKFLPVEFFVQNLEL